MAHEIVTPLVLDGWFILHQFFRLDPALEGDQLDSDGAPGPSHPSEAAGSDRTSSSPEPPSSRSDEAAEFARLLQGWEDLGDEGWSGIYRIVGGGADYMVMHFRSSLEALAEAEKAVQKAALGRDLIPTDDYLSVVELGMYGMTDSLVKEAQAAGVAPGSPEWDAMVAKCLEEEKAKRYVQARLQPRQPEGMPYVCFYPMDKRRNVGQNWYTLPLAERAALMADHGQTGRRYAGRISQIISGSVGFDDWEWAVTLFAGNPLDFKALVTEMRYDAVSALYAEFGSFWVGYRVPTDRLAEELAG